MYQIPLQLLVVANSLAKLFPSLRFLNFSTSHHQFHLDFVFDLPPNSGWVEILDHAAHEFLRHHSDEPQKLEMICKLVPSFCQKNHSPLHPLFFSYYALIDDNTTSVISYGQITVPAALDEERSEEPFTLIDLKPCLFAPPDTKPLRGYRLTGTIQSDKKLLKEYKKLCDAQEKSPSSIQLAQSMELIALRSESPYHLWLPRGLQFRQMLAQEWRSALTSLEIAQGLLPQYLPETSSSKHILTNIPLFKFQDHSANLIALPPLHAALDLYWSNTSGPYLAGFESTSWEQPLVLGTSLTTLQEISAHFIAALLPLPRLLLLMRQLIQRFLDWNKRVGLTCSAFLYNPVLPLPYNRKEQQQAAQQLQTLLKSLGLTALPPPNLPQTHAYSNGPGIGFFWHDALGEKFGEVILGPYFTIDLLASSTLFSKSLRAGLTSNERLLQTNFFGTPHSILQALLATHKEWWPAPIAINHLLIHLDNGTTLPAEIATKLEEFPHLRYSIIRGVNPQQTVRLLGIPLLIMITKTETKALATGRDLPMAPISIQRLFHLLQEAAT